MQTDTPKVTVLISTYNRPDYLKVAIQSVVDQTLGDWELLVMNDGGVDVGSVVAAFNDQRIRYFPDDVNRKLPYRFNFGLNAARGKYIAYLGDDDLFYPNHLRVLSDALDENPGVGVVYSDLYGVQFVKDEATGRRYPLNKMIQVARDYNRDFMFYFNHTLHVSLMHHRDLALKVGGYDENVTVLIDWNLTRKLSFYTDFKYVPVLTGEYYMPIVNSDRISNLERRDPEKFKHNLRKIKADQPPRPWPKVVPIAVVLPVDPFTDGLAATLTALIDTLSYPVQFVLVNNTDLTGNQLRGVLGKIGELKNVSIHTPPEPLDPLASYRFGAERTDTAYVYLPSKKVQAGLDYRLISALHYLDGMDYIGAKWSVEQERDGPFDIIIDRERFLDISHRKTGSMETVLGVVPPTPPPSLSSDLFHHLAKKSRGEGNLELALQFIRHAEEAKTGGAGEPFLIDEYARICFDLGLYDEAEQRCRSLIDKGYGADNWIRLGGILQAQGRFAEAVQAYRKGLDEIGLGDADLDNLIFPILTREDFGSFTAYVGLGECDLSIGDMTSAARMFRRAAKLKANSHLPFVGFARLFLRTGQPDRALDALKSAGGAQPQQRRDPAVDGRRSMPTESSG